MGVKISDKHGVNPSVSQCFYCMGDKNEVILFGKLKGDAEAPRKACIDMEPCEECAGHMEAGIILVSVDKHKTDDIENPYRSGGWVVVKDEAVQRWGIDSGDEAAILARRFAFVPDETWDMIGLPRGEMNETA